MCAYEWANLHDFPFESTYIDTYKVKDNIFAYIARDEESREATIVRHPERHTSVTVEGELLSPLHFEMEEYDKPFVNPQ
jgi:predicted DNA-binding protein (MmcQ/YjbR family)